MKILIVDDSNANRVLLASIIKRLGFEILLAENGREAVRSVELNRPDFILMDIMMPIEDGFSATTKIRKLDLGYWVPIIIISALTEPENIIKGLELGADDYLIKPVDVDLVRAKILVMTRIMRLQAENKELSLYNKEQLKKLEHENHSHLQLRRAVDEAAIVVETDVKGSITSVNSTFCSLSGYSEKELLGKNHRMLHSGVHPPEFFVNLWSTISQGHVWQGDICNRAKGGHLYWVHTTIVPFLDSHTGKPISYKAIRFDITERKKLESALHHEKTRAEITLESLTEGVLKTDVTGHVIFMNQAAERLTGWPIDLARNKKVENIFTLDVEEDFHPVNRVIESKQVVEVNAGALLHSHDGHDHLIECAASPLFDSDEFVGCVVSFQDVSEKYRLKEEVEWQAWHDALTNLPNRTLLQDRFRLAVSNANRSNSMIAVCVLDLDNFKPINDSYGHDYGDKVLVEVARRLMTSVRSDDTVARFGGDEFVLLLNDFHDHVEIDASIKRVFEALAKPYLINEQIFTVSSSIGLSVYPEDNVDPDTLLRHADQAMYQAKHSGKNQFTYYDAQLTQLSHDRSKEFNRIVQAYEQNEFVLFYQPKVNMRTGIITGAEALIRWEDPERGLLGPLDFLPHIENTPLMVNIGRWVIEQALIQLDLWLDQGKDWTISINIDAYHFMQNDFISDLVIALARHPNVLENKLEIEILETVAFDDLTQVSEQIADCQALGVNFALDDFGTGYSSLSYLKSLPAECLKIDQSFVRDMLDNRQDLALIEGIISLSKVFQRHVIAEGVETAEHGVVLMRLGCDHAQGYGIARPMPASDMEIWAQTYTPDESWSIWSGSDWEMSNLPLVVAQSDHIAWVQEIYKTLKGSELSLGHDELTNHYGCRLGSWYYGHGKAHYGHLSAFKDLEGIHVDVHEVGHKIISIHNKGQTKQALILFEELLELKSQVLNSLNTLQKQVNFTEVNT